MYFVCMGRYYSAVIGLMLLEFSQFHRCELHLGAVFNGFVYSTGYDRVLIAIVEINYYDSREISFYARVRAM